MAEDRTIQGVTMYCEINKIYCGMANETGYCKLSACINHNSYEETVNMFKYNYPEESYSLLKAKEKQIKDMERMFSWRTGTPTEEGWYLLKVMHEDEIVYYANLLENNTDLQWHYAMYGKIIAYKEIEP